MFNRVMNMQLKGDNRWEQGASRRDGQVSEIELLWLRVVYHRYVNVTLVVSTVDLVAYHMICQSVCHTCNIITMEYLKSVCAILAVKTRWRIAFVSLCPTRSMDMVAYRRCVQSVSILK